MAGREAESYLFFQPSGSFLNYTANSGIGSASISRSLLRESQKKERRKVSSEAEKILDAPSLMNDYCKYILIVH